MIVIAVLVVSVFLSVFAWILESRGYSKRIPACALFACGSTLLISDPAWQRILGCGVIFLSMLLILHGFDRLRDKLDDWVERGTD